MLLHLPVLSRDALKAGMIETWAFVQPGASREGIETDELRSILVPRSFDFFYAAIAQWLQALTSLIAEYGFDRRTEADLATVTPLAKTLVIHCVAPDRLRQRRFIEGEHYDGKIRADMQERIAEATDPWTRFEPLTLALLTLRVDTTDAYTPTLPAICAFCRDVVMAPLRPVAPE